MYWAKPRILGLQGGGQQAFSSIMTTFGAVKVGGKNFFRLLKNDETVLLYPGGVREVHIPECPGVVPRIGLIIFNISTLSL